MRPGSLGKDTTLDALNSAAVSGADEQAVSLRPASIEAPWPPATTGWWAITVFILTLAVGYLDRGVLTLLVESIKRDLHLTDTQMSLVIGFAFIVFYIVLGLPMARWVDSGSRRLILGISVSVWSLCTAFCGVAHNFMQLVACRLGMGAGEAAISPGIGSMIADLFPPERLARAMSVLALAYIGGNALAMLLGGAVIHAVAHLHSVIVPFFGPVFPWQLTFFIVGLPGLLVAALYFTVPEPARRGRLPGQGPVVAIPVREVGRYMAENRRVYLPMFLGIALNGMVSAGSQAWTPALFSRNYGWNASQFGSTAGTISLLLAPIGLLAGIRINEWLYRRGYHDANMRLTAIVTWLVLPGHVLMPIMPTAHLALVCFGWTALIGTAAIGSQAAALTLVTPNQMRGQVTALYMFVFNVIGYGLGPVLVALCTDFVFGHESDLRFSMLAIALLIAPAGALVLTLGIKPYGRAYMRTKNWQ